MIKCAKILIWLSNKPEKNQIVLLLDNIVTRNEESEFSIKVCMSKLKISYLSNFGPNGPKVWKQ